MAPPRAAAISISDKEFVARQLGCGAWSFESGRLFVVWDADFGCAPGELEIPLRVKIEPQLITMGRTLSSRSVSFTPCELRALAGEMRRLDSKHEPAASRLDGWAARAEAAT